MTKKEANEDDDIKPEINIVNIVVTGDLHVSVDLAALASNLSNVDYEPEQFPGAIFRVDDPKCAIILFKNGRIICTGLRTEEHIKEVLQRLADAVSKYVIEE
ncbi:MAG: TATA-box-binding protein [Candidatus Micrarchaeota archaeon]|nr:MAG: TATA-box-binding protein [Candidatus Micrarchaeota archaeon]